MKIRIKNTQLLKALSNVQSLVEKRNTIPILANVLIEAKDKSLVLNEWNV